MYIKFHWAQYNEEVTQESLRWYDLELFNYIPSTAVGLVQQYHTVYLIEYMQFPCRKG